MAVRGLLGMTILLASSLPGCGDDGTIDASCAPWCTVVEECTETSLSDCMGACARELAAARSVSPDCVNAVKGQNRCLADLTCADFEAWARETPPDAYPCKSADDAVVSACAS